MQPNTPLLTREQSKVAVFLQASNSYIDKVANVETRGLKEKEFATEFGNVLKPNDKDPEQPIRDLDADDHAKLIKLVEANMERSKKGSSTVYVKDVNYHLYAHIGQAVKVPALFLPVFRNPRSWLAFRGMLKFWAPFGGEVPSASLINVGTDDGLVGEDTRALVLRHQQEIVDYQRKQWMQDLAPTGTIALGHNFVHCDKAAIIETEKYLIRTAEMNAFLHWHLLRGRARWAQVLDKSDDTVTFMCFGAGRNPLPGVDRANNSVAGLVFGSMHQTYGLVMNEVAKKVKDIRQITDGSDDPFQAILDDVRRLNVSLAKQRKLANVLDSFSSIGILLKDGAEALGGPDLFEVCLSVRSDKDE